MVRNVPFIARAINGPNGAQVIFRSLYIVTRTIRARRSHMPREPEHPTSSPAKGGRDQLTCERRRPHKGKATQNIEYRPRREQVSTLAGALDTINGTKRTINGTKRARRGTDRAFFGTFPRFLEISRIFSRWPSPDSNPGPPACQTGASSLGY